LQVQSFDYIIVGGGSAGCVLANRLSADAGITVALIEAGAEDDYLWIRIPVGYLYCIGNPRTDWCYSTEAEAGLGGRALGYPRGKVLGGSSAINGMIYMRGQAADYDHWRSLGNAGWGWEDVLPYFRRSEDHHAGGDDLHGVGGEWRVERQRLSWEILDAFRAAAIEAGIRPTDDFNRGDNEGVGYFEVNQRSGVRWTTATGFLAPVRNRSNLTVLTGSQVLRVRVEQNHAVGVDVRRSDGSEVFLGARIETLLAGGAVASPQLLQVSGIGPASLLNRLGIPVVCDLQGVGANLQDHLQLRLVYEVAHTQTLNQLAHSWHGKLRMGLQYLFARRGPMTMSPSQLGAFARSDPRHARANVEYHVQPLSLERFGEPLHRFPAFTASVCNLRPTARGSVLARSPQMHDAPLIQPNYLSTDEDRRVAAESIRLTRRIVAQPALARFEPRERKPGDAAQSDADLVVAAGAIGTTIFHPVGTCAMGTGRDAVVDPRLRVHGVGRLRVVDASIMPTITSGNTNSPTIMIAEKASDLIREDRRG
jgi:choline dehydrogenase